MKKKKKKKKKKTQMSLPNTFGWDPPAKKKKKKKTDFKQYCFWLSVLPTNN